MLTGQAFEAARYVEARQAASSRAFGDVGAAGPSPYGFHARIIGLTFDCRVRLPARCRRQWAPPETPCSDLISTPAWFACLIARLFAR